MTLLAALRHPKTGYVLLFGFASGLPYALLLGTLYAWLTDAKVDVETMGVFSLVGLAYAFKFLWSPALDRVDLPGLRRLGKRKQWIVTAQLLLGGILVTLSLLDPLSSLGVFSLLAGIGAFASATQDVVIDAWRVDVADEVATIDILSTVFQMGYRVAALVGGALALFMAERLGWPTVFASMGGILLFVGFLGLFAPDAERTVAALAECLGVKVLIEYMDGRLSNGREVVNHVFGNCLDDGDGGAHRRFNAGKRAGGR